jgi:hypothetical protein
MSNPVATDHVTVLEAVARRLRDEVDEFNESTCIVTANPPRDIPPNINHNVFCTVSPTDGNYDESAFVGGAENSLIEEAGVMIVLMSSVKLDRVGHNSEILAHESRGLLQIKAKILKTLTGHQLKDTSGNWLLTEYMRPIRSESPQSGEDSGRDIGDLAIVFATPFLWDLT